MPETAILTCPKCGHKQTGEVPDNRCVHSYTCSSCGKEIVGKSKCVFCEFGDKKCPSGC